MELIQHNPTARERLHMARQAGESIGLVPTMGFLHEGHVRLIESARQGCDRVAVSLFVNPTQFGPGEDFERYPRDAERDRAVCEKAGVDWLYAPAAAELYPFGSGTRVVPPAELTADLCGAFRPDHFVGVATVVAKLFALWLPDRAYFGQKDFQQTVVVRRLAIDLCLPVDVVVVPTVREADGVALSSRNVYLSPAERQSARAIPRALAAAWEAARLPAASVETVLAAARSELEAEPGLRLQYLALVEPETLRPATSLGPDRVIAIAAHVGPTRLIDNLALAASQPPVPSRPLESTP